MQTFLPSPDFVESAKILDYKRLGQQRREAKMLLGIIETNPSGTRWKNQPLVLMWKFYQEALTVYYNCMVEEWIRRGYHNTMPILEVEDEYMKPSWLGLEQYHASHRATLLAKDQLWYSQFNWKEEPNLGYYWPVRNVKK